MVVWFNSNEILTKCYKVTRIHVFLGDGQRGAEKQW